VDEETALSSRWRVLGLANVKDARPINALVIGWPSGQGGSRRAWLGGI